jgi:hypothetical protein
MHADVKASQLRHAPRRCVDLYDVAGLLGDGSMSITARIILLTLSIAPASCAHQPPMSWVRTDGKPVAPIQYDADLTACRDEVQKARVASNEQPGLLSRLQTHDDVFAGCMAEKGYVQRPVTN